MARSMTTRVSRALCVSALLLIALLLLLAPASVAAFVIRLPSHSDQCFIETAIRGDKIVGSMRVVAGGSLDIDLRITDPGGQIVLDLPRRSDESFAFYARDTGSYKVCFSNSMSVVSGKVVAFSIHSGKALHEKDAAGAEHVSPLANSIAQLTQGIEAIRDSTSYSKTRERVHAQTVNSTNSRVVWWRCIQIAAVVGVAAFKTYYLTHLFERKRGV